MSSPWLSVRLPRCAAHAFLLEMRFYFSASVCSRGNFVAVAFIRCAPPIDPYKMVYAILEEVERTGEARSR